MFMADNRKAEAWESLQEEMTDKLAIANGTRWAWKNMATLLRDPLDNNIIYGGKITKFDKRTGQVQNIAPEPVRSGKYRFLRTAPVLFSPIDPKTLYFAGNVLFKTRDGGNNWEVVSPDLSRESWDIPESVGVYSGEELKKCPGAE